MSEWISAKERLPHLNQQVVAWRDGAGPVVLTYDELAHRHLTVTRSDGQWWNRGRQVTHWQPLPEPPKEIA